MLRNRVLILVFRQKRKKRVTEMVYRVLVVATVPSMIGQFNMNNVHILLNMGYEVDVAADFTDTSVWPSERIEKFRGELI